MHFHWSAQEGAFVCHTKTKHQYIRRNDEGAEADLLQLPLLEELHVIDDEPRHTSTKVT